MPRLEIDIRTDYFANPAIRAHINHITDVAQRLVAEGLNVPGHPEGELTPNDVSVKVSVGSSHDRGTLPFGFLIFANDYKERVLNLEARRRRIASGLVRECSLLEGQSSIYILLVPGSYQRL